MHVLSIASAALCLAACTGPPPRPPAPSPAASAPRGAAAKINSANIRRLRAAFPPGYEVAAANGVSAPIRFWGLGSDWVADPGQCGALADPLRGQGASSEGLSGSGPGGIVYAVVAASPAAAPDTDMVADCGRWSIRAAGTTGTVELAAAPAIDGAATLAMTTESRTVVEGGSATDSRTQTAMAYLGDYLAFVTVVTDPGSAQPQLPQDFASAFLIRAVATLRG